VVEDIRPGGHHGSVLLALNELIELREDAGAPAFIPPLRRASFRLVLVCAAVVMAMWETVMAEVSKRSLGAHHGVLFLGIAKILRCVGLCSQRSQSADGEEGIVKFRWKECTLRWNLYCALDLFIIIFYNICLIFKLLTFIVGRNFL
jgi:hypothetical protein